MTIENVGRLGVLLTMFQTPSLRLVNNDQSNEEKRERELVQMNGNMCIIKSKTLIFCKICTN